METRPYLRWFREGQRLLAANDRTGAAHAFERAVPHAATAVEREVADGQSALARGESPLALEAFGRAVAAEPGNADARFMLGLHLYRSGDATGGVEHLQHAVALSPNFWSARNTLGNALKTIGRYDEALAQYREAARLAPTQPVVRRNLGLLLMQAGDFGSAVDELAHAIRISPADALAHTYLGMALVALGRYDDAEVAFRGALAQAPQDALPLLHWGEVRRLRGDMVGARELFDRAQRLAPEDASLALLATTVRRALVDWREYENRRSWLLANLEHATHALDPYLLLPITDSAPLLRRVAERHAEYHRLGASMTEPILVTARRSRPARPADGRIRLGYASFDFGDHATTFLLAQVLELHDRSRFAVHVYSWSDMVGTAGFARVRAATEVFRDVRQESSARIAAHMLEDGIDVAVDLKGYTLNCRPGIFARRAAPVQVNWLGYPGTTGAPYMDYLIADARIVPPGDEDGYTERIVRLPDSYQPNDRTRAIASPRTRAAYGLPEHGVVFCSFNLAYKLDPTLFDAWCRLLGNVDDSALWLLEMQPEQASNLRREASSRGIDPARLVFAPFASAPEHLARYAVADVALDTFPVGSHTTGADALWGGCPLIALRGDSFASRVSSSLLHAAGLPDLITNDAESYVALATALAHDPERRAVVRARVAEAARAPAPLFDPERFCRHLEEAYRTMHERHVAGLPPAHFDVSPRG